MKKILSILLLCFFLLPSVSTWIWFEYHQKAIKKEVKHHLMAQVDDSELELLVFTQQEMTNQLTWEHEKEFQYKGVMYDIVKRDWKDGRYYFWCWKDDKETQLNKKLEQLLAKTCGKDPQQQQKQQQLFQFFHTLFHTKPTPWETIANHSPSASNLFDYTCHYQSISLEQQTPPPNFI